MIRILLLAWVGLTAPALSAAAAQDDAVTLYRSGDFARAEQIAVTASDAGSKTLAAQAVLAQLMSGALADLPEGERRQVARRAQSHARSALDIDPDHAPAHLRLAAAYGYEGRYVAPLRAFMMRLPQRGRDHIEQAMALEPENPWGPAMLGAWHFEVARRGGEGRLGSDLQAAFTHYRAAVAMDGVEPAIPYHFALALVAKDPVAHRAEIDALLAQVAAHPAEAAFDQTAQTLGASLASMLQADPVAAQLEAIARLES